jgi:DNA-binding CsgD family transcriptional regulator
MILARFHAVPAATESAQISMIVGLLEPISVGQRSAETLTPADFRFTEREQACVTHLVQGMTDKEIARHLGLSEYTVKDHFKQVRKKTDATNRSGIIARVLGRAQTPRNGTSVVKASHPSANARLRV